VWSVSLATLTPTFPLLLQQVNSAYNATTGMAMSAAKSTPGLRTLVESRVHKGFWTAYQGVRCRIHAIVRRECRNEYTSTQAFNTTSTSTGNGNNNEDGVPSLLEVVTVGHSLGGALATFCALDIATHTAPRVKAYRQRQRQQKMQQQVHTSDSHSTTTTTGKDKKRMKKYAAC
jgi:hypothetical protein